MSQYDIERNHQFHSTRTGIRSFKNRNTPNFFFFIFLSLYVCTSSWHGWRVCQGQNWTVFTPFVYMVDVFMRDRIEQCSHWPVLSDSMQESPCTLRLVKQMKREGEGVWQYGKEDVGKGVEGSQSWKQMSFQLPPKGSNVFCLVKLVWLSYVSWTWTEQCTLCLSGAWTEHCSRLPISSVWSDDTGCGLSAVDGAQVQNLFQQASCALLQSLGTYQYWLPGLYGH